MNNSSFSNNPLPILTFDKNRRRVKQCPCGKSNKDGKFVPFEGYEDKGYCHSCGENFLPEIKNYNIGNNFQPQRETKVYKPKPTSFISAETVLATLKEYETNNFVTILIKHFGIQVSNLLIAKYFIGTSRHWPGANVFWQVDQHGKIRTGKIMLYNQETDKRIKEPISFVTWAHTILKLPDFNLMQCLFGSHLLIDSDKWIAIAESEKTAIVASVYFPDLIWLATGGKNGCKWTSSETLSALKGRKVILWPDANAFDLWSESASELQKWGIDVVVSDLLERKASTQERKDGVDIADYLLKYPPNLFNPEQMPRPP